ncbi:uncharacterized protein FOMMEDRAFT_145459 [Fomitiporia mediterranea MF3/22]|uniref:uncharacterized protein n=1 Tax=Fomitiporia mediterranea (strain MF3/22) TaxID=694068 RepID=UPI0004408EFB|nr:uncharacterized protein FOMMEDRAFT_145459 [Fomitiporia mediterranea MF3/22]EJD06206.1 hypothetical protein FOMMEDRAFT_145459 [Fomitiporia mediterranea MF3/22]
MNVIGSVFLGDAARSRVLSPSPTSPPTSPALHTSSAFKGPAPTPIDPQLSLELRIRWLEVLLLGVKQDSVDHSRDGREDAKAKDKEGETKRENDALALKAEQLQKKFDSTVESNDGLRKFMDRYDQHAQILTPSFALSGAFASTSGPSSPGYGSMSSEELDALLTEMEPEIRAAERDLREIDVLEKRGVLGAGKLADYESSTPRVDALRKAHEEDLATVANIERRIANVLREYTTRIDALSELFVEWNDVLLAAEEKITRLEREKTERVKLGFDEAG